MHLLYDSVDEIVDFFENVHGVRIRSSCLSPLGLCLVQFQSATARQPMINLSPIQLDDDRLITVQAHDRGINLRSCPFTRTCWVMFLAFPLDFKPERISLKQLGTLVLSLPGPTMLDVAQEFLSDAILPWLVERLEVCLFVKPMHLVEMVHPRLYQFMFWTAI